MSTPLCTKSELDVFAAPPLQKAIVDGEWLEFHALHNITDSGPIEFNIPGNSEYYLDLAQTYIKVKAKITNNDGTAIKDTDKVGPVNLFLHALFSDIQVNLGDRIITPATGMYPYRAYIETLLNYGPAAKQSLLTSSLYYKDTAGEMDSLTTNRGFAQRKKLHDSHGTIDMVGFLHADIFCQPRLLLNHIDVKIKLVRAKDAFALMGEDDKFKIKIEQALVVVRREKPSTGVQLGHAKALQTSSAKYPILRTYCKSFSIPTGNLTFTQDNVFQGQLPQRLIVGMVDNDAFNGSVKKNPFNFQNYGLNFISCYVDGKSVPFKALTPNFESGLYISSYFTLFQATGRGSEDSGNDISREDYPNGYTLFGFDLTPDSCPGDHFNIVRNSNLRLEMHFDKPLQNTINVILFTETNNVIEVDKSRMVLFDFST